MRRAARATQRNRRFVLGRAIPAQRHAQPGRRPAWLSRRAARRSPSTLGRRRFAARRARRRALPVADLAATTASAWSPPPADDAASARCWSSLTADGSAPPSASTTWTSAAWSSWQSSPTVDTVARRQPPQRAAAGRPARRNREPRRARSQPASAASKTWRGRPTALAGVHAIRKPRQTTAIKLLQVAERHHARGHPAGRCAIAGPAFDPAGQVPLFHRPARLRPGVRRAAVRPGLPARRRAVRDHAARGPAGAVHRRDRRRPKASETPRPAEETAAERPPVRHAAASRSTSTASTGAWSRCPCPRRATDGSTGIKDKALFSSHPVEGARGRRNRAGGLRPHAARVHAGDQKCERLVDGISTSRSAATARRCCTAPGDRLRVLEAGEKPRRRTTSRGARRGWIDLERVKVSIEPSAEWRQMFREAWRLQREQFWTDGHVGASTGTRSTSAICRWSTASRTRSEFSDLLWELQGELGTSHAYEMGGEYRPGPHYRAGLPRRRLGGRRRRRRYRIARIIDGDVWSESDTRRWPARARRAAPATRSWRSTAAAVRPTTVTPARAAGQPGRPGGAAHGPPRRTAVAHGDGQGARPTSGPPATATGSKPTGELVHERD